MADISQITIPNGNGTSTYTLKDSTIPSWARGASAPIPTNGLMSTAFGCGAVTWNGSVTLPIAKRLYIVTLSAATTLAGITSGMVAGLEVHYIIKGGSADLAITLPTGSNFVNVLGESTLTVKASSYGEINVVLGSDGKYYLRAV